MKLNEAKNYLRRRYPPVFKGLRFVKRTLDAFSIENFTPYRWRRYDDNAGFHGDNVWCESVRRLKEHFSITSFVETGTYKGDTASFLATVFDGVPIYTIELNRGYWRESRRRLKQYQHVHVLGGSSPKVLAQLIEGHRLGDFPALFLDAHSYDYWPLGDELSPIAQLEKAIIMIDDLKVPDEPQFAYDIYCGLGHIPERVNDLGAITRRLRGHQYRMVFPRYRAVDAYPSKPQAELRGYVVIFQDVPENEWRAFASERFLERYKVVPFEPGF